MAFAYAQIGCPYVFGGTGPCNSGFDCSGLMMEAWGSAGVSIPRISNDQIADLPQVDLAAGDPTSTWSPATSWASPATRTSGCMSGAG